jgi:hypothetical protein
LIKNKGKTSVSMSQLDKLMSNAESNIFSFDMFKAAYDQDERIKNLVTNFDKNKVDFKNSEVDDLDKPAGNKDTVGDMAKNAVDLSSL